MTKHTKVFAQQIQVIAATSAFKHAISDQWNHQHDLSPSTPKTEKLTNAIRLAQSVGVAIWPILTQEEKFPSAALLVAHSNVEMNPSGSTEIEPLPSKWTYLLWFLNHEYISTQIKVSRLKMILEHLKDNKLEISRLARLALKFQRHFESPEPILILASEWIVDNSGIRTLLSQNATYGPDQRNQQHVSMPYLRKIANDPNRLVDFFKFFGEARPCDRKYLAATLCEIVADGKTNLEYRRKIAKAMLMQIDPKSPDFLYFWDQYAKALILFFNYHPDFALCAEIESICDRATTIPDDKGQDIAPWQTAMELLACFGGEETIFNKLWKIVNEPSIKMSAHIEEAREIGNQCERHPKRYLALTWREIVKRLVKACYRNDLSLKRLVTALRTSPQGPVGLIVAEIGAVELATLFNRGDEAVVFGRIPIAKDDDPISIQYLLEIFRPSSIKPIFTPAPAPVVTQELLDTQLIEDLSNNEKGVDAAIRLLENIKSLNDRLKAMVLLRVLGSDRSSTQCHGGQSLAAYTIEQCGGAKAALSLIQSYGHGTGWSKVAIKVAEKHGKLLFLV